MFADAPHLFCPTAVGLAFQVMLCSVEHLISSRCLCTTVMWAILLPSPRMAKEGRESCAPLQVTQADRSSILSSCHSPQGRILPPTPPRWRALPAAAAATTRHCRAWWRWGSWIRYGMTLCDVGVHVGGCALLHLCELSRRMVLD